MPKLFTWLLLLSSPSIHDLVLDLTCFLFSFFLSFSSLVLSVYVCEHFFFTDRVSQTFVFISWLSILCCSHFFLVAVWYIRTHTGSPFLSHDIKYAPSLFSNAPKKLTAELNRTHFVYTWRRFFFFSCLGRLILSPSSYTHTILQTLLLGSSFSQLLLNFRPGVELLSLRSKANFVNVSSE